MKRTVGLVVAVAAMLAILAVAVLLDEGPERSEREAFIYQCNEEGGGGTFTSREYCEELYDRSKAGRGAERAN